MGKHRLDNKRPRHIRRIMWNIIKYTILSMFVLGFACLIFFSSYLMGLEEWKEFDPNKIGDMQQTLLIYDKDGIETAALFNQQNRVYISIDDIPSHVKNAFIAVEDVRFYEHNGIDIIRWAGAFLEGIKSGSRIRGTSSISQQLVKNTSLTGVRTISRKLQEAVMALKLEQVYEKDKILEMYLNYIYFGNGAYGIEAAAKVYFNTNTASLTIAQAAQLAGVIRSPTNYAPHINMQKSIDRRNLVISLMEEENYITHAQAEKAKSESVELNDKIEVKHGFFIDLVLSEAEDILSLSSEELLSSGYKIYSTLDQEMQDYAEELFSQNENFPDNADDGELCQAALCIIDSAASEIRAVIGGRDYETRRGLNRALDIKRQPGSAIKPVIVYAPAMEKLGLLPTSLVLDERGDFDGYIPKNYSDHYSGWVTLRRAISSSLNLPAVRVFEKVGIEAGKLYASNVGIPFDEKDVGLTLALGGFTTGVSPLNLANSFTPFANGGYYSYPSCITKIEDRTGEIIYIRPETKINVLSKETAFLMTTMLQSAATVGTAKRIGIEGMSIAAKTGTSGADNISGNKDAWTVGYNTDYTICCWMGFDNTDENHCLESNVTGGTYPAKLIKKIFEKTYADMQSPDFAQPSSIVQAQIDLQSIQNDNEPQLASTFTPEGQTALEYFTQETAPTEYTSYWVVPTPPDDLLAAHGSGGYPIISFTPKQSFALYRLMRMDISDGKPQMIGEYSGGTAKISINDFNVEYGHTYKYYVVPVHPQINIEGEQLAGPPSLTVKITLLSEESYMP